MLMSIQEFAVHISKEARNREKMLHPQYLHGLKYPPLEHLPRNAALLLQLQLHIPLASQHIYVPPENHVSTCTKELIIITTVDEEIMAKPAIVSAGYNTEICTYCDVGTNTARVVTSEASIQTELPTVSCVDANTMTEEDNVENTTPFRIEQIKDDSKMVKFYTGFPSFQLLMVCFQFLGSAASNLSYGDHTKVAKGKPHKLSPLNEFFLMLCRLRLGLFEQDLAYRFQLSQSSVSRIFSTWISFCYYKFKELHIWPSRSVVDCNMPAMFKDLYPSTRCIIDATEVFI